MTDDMETHPHPPQRMPTKGAVSGNAAGWPVAGFTAPRGKSEAQRVSHTPAKRARA